MNINQRRSYFILVALMLTFMTACGDTKQIATQHKNTPFLVVLCRFQSQIPIAPALQSVSNNLLSLHSDAVTGPTTNKFVDEPHQQPWFQDFISESGKGKHGLYDYWIANSLGSFDLTGSKAIGWFQLSKFAANYIVSHNDQNSPNGISDEAKAECSANAKSEIAANPGKYVGIITIFNAQSSWCYTNGPLANNASFGLTIISLDPRCLSVTTVAHEMGHAYGLPHTFAAKTNGDPHQTGSLYGSGRYLEYGNPVDLMSAGQVLGYTDLVFGTEGPELSAPYRYTLGFIPPARILTFGSKPQSEMTLNVEAIDQADLSNNYLIAYFALSNYAGYMVEYRDNGGYDKNITDKSVLIYEFSHKSDNIWDQQASLIMQDRGQMNDFTNNVLDAQDAEWVPGQTFYDSANGVQIDIISFNADHSVTIHLKRNKTVPVTPSPFVTPIPSFPNSCTPNCPALPPMKFTRMPHPDPDSHIHPTFIGFPLAATPDYPDQTPVPVLVATPSPTPMPPRLTAAIVSGTYTCNGGGSPYFPTITLTNSGAGQATWQGVTSDPSHVTLNPASGSVAANGGTQQVTLSGAYTVNPLNVSFTVQNQGIVTITIPCGKP